VSTAAIGSNCWLLQARRLASSTHRFRRRAGVVLGHTRELVQYMPCPKCENEIIKITLATIAAVDFMIHILSYQNV
jgi:cytochrome c-type biogenesis protein CcmH/NrfF